MGQLNYIYTLKGAEAVFNIPTVSLNFCKIIQSGTKVLY